MLTFYNQLKRGPDESIKSFSARFNIVYNSLPTDYKPLVGMAKLHFAEAFDDEFALFLRERRSPTLAQMMSNAIEVEINMMSSKRGRYKVDARETRKPKEEPQASTSIDPKFDSLIKIMEKLVDKLSIDGKPTTNVPHIRNPNYRQPRKQDAPPPQIAQRGQRLPNNTNNNTDQVRPPFQQNLVEDEFLLVVDEEINSIGGEEEKCFLTKQQHDDHLQGANIQRDDYQQGYQNSIIVFQRQLNLRNRDVIISKPQKKTNEDKASTSDSNKDPEEIQVNPRLGKGKEIIVNKLVVTKETVVDNPIVNKDQKK